LYRWVKFNGYCGKVSKIKEELLSKEPSFIIMEEKKPSSLLGSYTGYLRPCSAIQIG